VFHGSASSVKKIPRLAVFLRDGMRQILEWKRMNMEDVMKIHSKISKLILA
jgi:hypothetical protein